ncbi:MAG TPA: MmgE/PrpD family protein [Candidatus Limnocylindria bacterium]|nr:MmgE/PrpD family protein [Candidatus Limnocylindria bacterium]
MTALRGETGRASAAATATAPGALALAEFCLALRWETLPAAVQDRARELLLDHIGVTLGGLESASSAAVQRFVEWVSGSGGRSTMIGRRTDFAPEWAALANGTVSHAIEMDDCTRESSLHPGVSVIPAALAVAEEAGVSLAELLTAMVSGYEVTMRAGAALNPESAYRRGFHPTGVAGVFGATTAAAQLLGLSPQQLAYALGIAGTMASGSLEYLSEGSWTKRLNPGWAAHAGIVAARLAAAGYRGPTTAFEGPLGFLHAYSDAGRPERLLADLGEPLQIMKVAIKPYACCRYVHALIDATLALREEHDLDPEQVEHVDLGVLSLATDLVSHPIERKRDPASIVDAQFSAPYAAAVALVTGRAGMRQFSDELIGNAQIRRLMAATDCHTDPALDATYPDGMPGSVRFRMRDGRILESRVDFPLGEPENALSRAELVARFAELSASSVDADAAGALAQRLLSLAGGEPVAELTGLLRGPFGGGPPR